MKKLLIPTIIIHALSTNNVIADIGLRNVNKWNNLLDSKNYYLAKDPNKSDSNKQLLIWEKVIEGENSDDKKVIWELFDNKVNNLDDTNTKKTLEEKFSILEDEMYSNNFKINSLYLGHAVPTANTLEQNGLTIAFSQIAPIKNSYNGGGTGNQNYLAEISYGFKENLTLSGFYSHSDDPLHLKINSLTSQPSNLWISYGSSLTWNKSLNKNLKIALNGSIESWNVKSGGCNLYKCTSTSNNIFNSNINAVENNNLIGSLSLPISWKLTKKWQATLTPRMVFLPSKQGNHNGSGNFYGNNYGIGTGIEYKPIKKLKTFTSVFIPTGPGYNVFDENLEFKRKPIFTGGINYHLDSKIALEGSISNGFGLSPSTGILALPSANEALYKVKISYTPTNYSLNDPEIEENYKNQFGGLSVSSAELLQPGKKRYRGKLNNKGSWESKIDWGLSESFNFDIAFASISEEHDKSIDFKHSYHNPNENFYRGGGKIKLFQNKDQSITSAIRLSAGRVIGTGWIFSEILNTYKLNKNLNFNFNPKLAASGTGNPIAIGTSANWEIFPGISLIPETNIGLKETKGNWTLAIRFSNSEDKFLDIFTTNSLSFVDTGQILQAKGNSFGINIGTIF